MKPKEGIVSYRSEHHNFLARQAVFGKLAFGSSERTEGVMKHILEELDEIRECASADDRAREWVDVLLLAQDALLRACREALTCVEEEPSNDATASYALSLLIEKRDKNESREWVDWRSLGENDSISHVGSKR